MVASDVRERLLEATLACAGRYGIAKTTIEDVARAAALSRATVYRYFPGGKDELVREVVAWEVGRFFARLTRAVAGHTDFTDLLCETLVVAAAEVTGHQVLQKVLQTEPEVLLPLLTVESTRLVALVKSFLVVALERAPLRPSIDGDAAAEYLARMIVSLIGAPGRWNLADRAEVRRLVRSELLGGLLEQ